MPWNPEPGKPPAKILLIQFRRIGDVVLVTPVLDALRSEWPRARVHLLTAPPVPELFAGDDRVDVVWTRPPRRYLGHLARDLKSEEFDLVLDFQSLPLSAVLARATGGYSVGFQKRVRSLLYHRAVSLDTHRGSDFASDHKLDLLRALGPKPVLSLPRLVAPEIEVSEWEDAGPAPRVAMVPVSLRAHKRWKPRAFAAAARALHQATGAVFVLAGGPGEGAALEEVAGDMGSVPHRVRVFERLREFAGFLSRAHLFLGNDNGPRHIALALGTPTLAYFGTQNPSHWTPPGTKRHRVIWSPERARGRRVRDDLQPVPEDPEAVAAAAAELLRFQAVES